MRTLRSGCFGFGVIKLFYISVAAVIVGFVLFVGIAALLSSWLVRFDDLSQHFISHVDRISKVFG